MSAALLEAHPPVEMATSPIEVSDSIAKRPSRIRRIFRGVGWLTVRAIGLVMLLVGLSVLATLPLLQFAVLGYLLEAARRASFPGGLKRALPGVAEASHIGLGVVASLIFWLPVWVLADRAFAATLLSPGTAIEADAIRTFKVVRFLVVVHLIVAWLKGGRIRDFVQPWASAWWIVKAIFRPRIVAER